MLPSVFLWLTKESSWKPQVGFLLSNRILSAKLPKIHVAWTAIDASTNSWHSSHATWELQKHPSRHPLDPPGPPSGSWRPIIVEKIVKLCAFRLSNLVKLHLTHLITKIRIRQKWLGINLFKGKLVISGERQDPNQSRHIHQSLHSSSVQRTWRRVGTAGMGRSNLPREALRRCNGGAEPKSFSSLERSWAPAQPFVVEKTVGNPKPL